MFQLIFLKACFAHLHLNTIYTHACMYDGISTSPQAHVMISMLAAWGAKTAQLCILTQPIN